MGLARKVYEKADPIGGLRDVLGGVDLLGVVCLLGQAHLPESMRGGRQVGSRRIWMIGWLKWMKSSSTWTMHSSMSPAREAEIAPHRAGVRGQVTVHATSPTCPCWTPADSD